MSELPDLSAGFAAGCPIADLVLSLSIGFTLREWHDMRTANTTPEEASND